MQINDAAVILTIVIVKLLCSSITNDYLKQMPIEHILSNNICFMFVFFVIICTLITIFTKQKFMPYDAFANIIKSNSNDHFTGSLLLSILSLINFLLVFHLINNTSKHQINMTILKICEILSGVIVALYLGKTKLTYKLIIGMCMVVCGVQMIN